MVPSVVKNLGPQVGRLFFITSTGTGSCPAAVISRHRGCSRHSMVIAAGHCVHRGGVGNAGDRFIGFVLVPAYDGTKAHPGAGCSFGVGND